MAGRISIHEAPRWVAALDAEMRAAARKGLLSAALRVQQLIVGELIPNAKPPPVDRGAYKAGWRVTPIPEGAFISNSAPHAPIVEDGVRPGFAVGRKMIDAIAAWAKRKGLRPEGKKKGKVPDGWYRDLAWAIAKSIAAEGRPGLHIWKKAEARIPGFIREEVERELRKVKARH